MAKATALDTTRRSRAVRRKMGRLPLRAQVVATGSRKEKPNSSKNTIIAPSRRLFFLSWTSLLPARLSPVFCLARLHVAKVFEHYSPIYPALA